MDKLKIKNEEAVRWAESQEYDEDYDLESINDEMEEAMDFDIDDMEDFM